MKASKNVNAEGLDLNATLSDDLQQAVAAQCYLIHRDDREPHEDEDVDEEIYSTALYFFTATSKTEALELQVHDMKAEGFRELEDNEKCSDDIREWTDEWTNTTLEVYAMDEDKFWEFMNWPENFLSDELVTWASKNGALAVQLLTAAQAGSSSGHKAAAQNQGLLSVVEKFLLSMEIPVKQSSLKSRRRKTL